MIAIQTRYLPATKKLGRRVVAFTCTGHRLVVPLDDSLSAVDAHFKAAKALISAEFKHAPDSSTMSYGSTDRGYFFAWTQSEVSA
jgi:hypothetical protein